MEQVFFFNGHLITQNPNQPIADALWVEDGKIKAVGKETDLRASIHSSAQQVNLQSKALLPAFNDAHIHLWKVGDLLRFQLDLRGVASIPDLLAQIKNFAAIHPQAPWILARGFNELTLAEGRMPTREDLDKVLPDRPCFVVRTCAHIAVVNTAALNHLPLPLDAPPGGEIRLDANGQPTGIFTETALGLFRDLLPPTTPAAYHEMILAAQDKLLSLGIAAATDPAVAPDLMSVYREMEQKGELKIRVNAIAMQVPDGGRNAFPLPEPFETDYLKVNAVKFFADGGLSGKTAALIQPYKNTTEHGVLRLDFDFFQQLAEQAQAAGFKIATHAIGDQAIEQVLQVYASLAEKNGKGLKHRIEHLGLPSAEHLVRMLELGIQCVSQPIFLEELGGNFIQYLTTEYLDRVYPYRSVLDAGVTLAFSSDAPVVKEISPLHGISSAVRRTTANGQVIAPSETISIEEAIQAYTLGAAAANNDDDKMGRLQTGYWADFVILDRNPLDVSSDQLKSVQVLGTWVGGKKMYEQP
jgi:predicted amidohydrolase YtcJ